MAELAARRQPATSRERLPSGGSEFLGLLATLLRRPRRGDRRLPLVWLVRADGAPDLIGLLHRVLNRGQRRRIPHAVLDLPSAAPATTSTTAPSSGAGLAGGDPAAVLREVHRQLSLEAFGGQRLRFRHYPLADWLLRQNLSEEVDAGDRRRGLVRRLRDRHGRPAGGDDSGSAPIGGDDPVSTAYQFVFWLIRRAIPGVVFRLAVSGRVPLLGRHYRWFMRQHYLAPRQSVTFLGFAERLTAGWRDAEQPDQVHKLLVHAFLEDLRQAYRRRIWRPSDWRRTAYRRCCSTGWCRATPGTPWFG